MNRPEGIVEAQTDALLRRVAREQEARCRHARDSAAEQAGAIVTRAWAEARARLRQAVEEERRSLDQTLTDHRAARDTEARHKSQVVLRTIMDDAWEQLPARLATAWQQDGARRRWCRSACAAAKATLDPAEGCTLEVDTDAESSVEDVVRKALNEWAAGKVEVRHIESLGPGLRVRCGRACIDATVRGLLASRERIEAELLAEIERLDSPAGESPP